MGKNHTVEPSKIIKLYEDGYSAKDICGVFGLSALTVRKILQDAGFTTHIYRKIEQFNKDKILLLVKAGYSYRQIEKLLHVSFYLIREVVEDAGLIGFSPNNHPAIQLTVKEQEISAEKLKRLGDLYNFGNCGLAKCAELAGVSDKEFLWFVFHSDERMLTRHNDHMRIHVIKLHSDGMPVTAIAKQMSISPSIVKKLLKLPINC